MRLSADLKPESEQIIKKYRAQHIPSTELVRRALDAFDYLERQQRAGNRVVVIDGLTGETVEELRVA